jgi:dienelactone hydrolase
MKNIARLVIAVLLAASAPAWAGTRPTTGGPTLTGPQTDCHLAAGDVAAVRKYWPAPGAALAAGDPRCSPNGTNQQRCSLSGWLYTPSKPVPGGHFATLIYVHGSGETPKEACRMIKFFLERKFLVFTPLLRGTRAKNGAFENSGITLDQFLAPRQEQWLTAHPAEHKVPTDVTEDFKIDFVAEEVAEVKAALAYVATLPQVDATRIAISGHSFGGSTTLLAASEALAPQPAVAVDLSGAVLSWGNSPRWEQRLGSAAKLHRIPILFTQTVNEGPQQDPTAPVVSLARAAESADKSEVMAAIFSRIDGVQWGHDAHIEFMTNGDQVDRWAPVMADFLARHGVK